MRQTGRVVAAQVGVRVVLRPVRDPGQLDRVGARLLRSASGRERAVRSAS